MPSNTRRNRVLALLKSRRGRWVPVFELMREGGAQFQTRVFELRREGFDIRNRIERRNGEVLSRYCLLEAGQTAPLF